MATRILISAGEDSGDLYASSLAAVLLRRRPDLELFGCAGPRMQQAGVKPVVDAASLSVVGLVEVLIHLPRIFVEYRKLLREVRRDRPAAAILTDSPDFHLRLAKQLKKLGVPVVYLIAPQVWAWRAGRLPAMRRTIDRLLCIFPFEQQFFRKHNIPAEYIGHPLVRLIRPSAERLELRRRFHIPEDTTLIVLLPGSRRGEVLRHLPYLLDAARTILHSQPARFILALPGGFSRRGDLGKFTERFSRLAIQVQEGQTWDVLACADLAIAASGTVTIEACLLKTPMVVFYRVNRMSWHLGKRLLRVPFLSMVNLVAGRQIVPELIQNAASGQNLAKEAVALLSDEPRLRQMRIDLASVAECLQGPADPMESAATAVERYLKEEIVHA